MTDTILLKKGQRGLLVGRTGSGKTQNAIFQLRHSPVFPVIVFDTKIEDDFFGLPVGDETLELVESLAEFQAMAKRAKKDMPDYILVRPALEETQDIDILDKYCEIAYNYFGQCLIYYDELYNWHNGGRAGNNLIGILTRGRSRGKTTLMSTQRPSWISRFCLTESDKFYILQLTDGRDRKSLSEVVPNFIEKEQPPKHHFWYYNVAEGGDAKLYAPVPYQKLDKTAITRQKWI